MDPETIEPQSYLTKIDNLVISRHSNGEISLSSNTLKCALNPYITARKYKQVTLINPYTLKPCELNSSMDASSFSDEINQSGFFNPSYDKDSTHSWEVSFKDPILSRSIHRTPFGLIVSNSNQSIEEVLKQSILTLNKEYSLCSSDKTVLFTSNLTEQAFLAKLALIDRQFLSYPQWSGLFNFNIDGIGYIVTRDFFGIIKTNKKTGQAHFFLDFNITVHGHNLCLSMTQTEDEFLQAIADFKEQIMPEQQ